MIDTTIIGIDCATKDTNVGLALAEVSSGRCTVISVRTGSTKTPPLSTILVWAMGRARVLLSMDAPLGWPNPMGTALSAHVAGNPVSIPADVFFRRTTDKFVRDTFEKQSLDVGADRIARTAHAALHLLDDLRCKTGFPIPLAWQPSFSHSMAAIEVYPAATLISYGLPETGYKDAGGAHRRKMIIQKIGNHISLPADQSLICNDADALDAVLCVIAGYDFLLGTAIPPQQLPLAEKEGWIWVRKP